MYNLETSAGYRVQTSTVEQVASALAAQLRTSGSLDELRWTVTTPHGSVLTDQVHFGSHAGHDVENASAHVDHAYALLVRDHLTSGVLHPSSGLIHTSRLAG